jgi:non-heme chloroperoxidase
MSSFKSLDVNGVTLSYVEKGTGQPVIFVHGILSDYRAWAALTDSLPSFKTISYSRRCAFPNLRNDFENSTIENNAEDLAQFIKAKGVTPAHLVSHSYGAFIALYCAYKNPALLRSLTLIEPYVPTFIIKDPKSAVESFSLLLRKPALALAARKIQNKSIDPSLKALDGGLNEQACELFMGGVQGDPDAYSKFPVFIKSMMLTNAGTINEMRTKTPSFTAKEAQAIQTPTMLISGENTHKTLAAIAEELLKSIPGVEFVKISNSAHCPLFENPEETNLAIEKFLSHVI